MSMPRTVNAPMNRTMVPDRNMSWYLRAPSRSGPKVGRLKTMDTIIAPENRSGIRKATPLTRGLSATRTGYLRIVVRSDSPLAQIHRRDDYDVAGSGTGDRGKGGRWSGHDLG